MKSVRFERLALIAILLLAAYLRLNHLGWTEFKLDEARLSRLSLDLVRGVEFPLVGIGSSAGIVNLPLASWLLAIPYAISSSPIVATGFVALMNVAAVAGCYGLTRRWLNETVSAFSALALAPSAGRKGTAEHASYAATAALIATLLFAVAPWVVLHARKLWANNLMAPFVIVWAWTAWLAYVDRRSRALIGHALALAVCIHLHYSALLLLPVSAMWAVAFARRIRWKHAVAAVVLFAATFAPFLVTSAARGGQIASGLLEVTGRPAEVDGQALYLARLIITGQEIHSLAGPQEYQNWLSDISAVEALAGSNGPGLNLGLAVPVIVGGVLALIDIIRAAQRRAFDDRSAASLMMLTWLLVPLLLQLRHGLPLFAHYFLFLYPVPFVLIGSLYVRWSVAPAQSDGRVISREQLGRVGRWVLIAFVVTIGILQSIQSLTLQQFVATRATPGAHGVPVEMTLRVVEEIVRASEDMGGAEALVYAEGDNPREHSGPAVLDVLLPPHIPRRFVDLGQAVSVYPRQSAVIVVYSPNGMMLPKPLSDQSTLYRPESIVPFRPGEGSAQVRIWPGQDLASPPCDPGSRVARWQNGVTLLGVGIEGDWRGSGGWVELCYRVETGPSSAAYHWFTHVMGPDGLRWAQVDGPGYPAAAWRAGDVVIAWFGQYALPAEAPFGRYRLRVGMYTYPDVINVPRADVGDLATDFAEIELGSAIP